MEQSVYFVDLGHHHHHHKEMQQTTQFEMMPNKPSESVSCWKRFTGLFKDEKTNAMSPFKIIITALALFLTTCVVAILIVLGLTGKFSGQHKMMAHNESANITKYLNASSLNACGFSSSLSRLDDVDKLLNNSRPTIIRGIDAKPYSMPWIVSLRSVDQIGSHFCAGSLITREHVLTAAHCVFDREAANLAIIVGLDTLNSFGQANIYYAENLWVNENYGNLINDIALIKLTKPVELDARVSTICLTNQDDGILEKSLIVAGWGNINEGGRILLPSSLQRATLRVINDDVVTCGQSSIWSRQSSNYVLCAIGDTNTGETNVCLGDSGGPLVGNRNGLWYLYGIVSYVLVDPIDSSCLTYKPSYFTRVAKYYEWVANKLDQ